MTTLILILILLNFLWLAMQDFKTRSIALFLLGSLFILNSIYALNSIEGTQLAVYFIQNISFIFLQIFLLQIYLSIRHKKWVYLPDQYIGWGDLLFFIPICLSFSTIIYIYLFIFTLIISLLLFGISQLIIQPKPKTIPLAGLFSIVWSLFFIIFHFRQWNRFDDYLILQNF